MVNLITGAGETDSWYRLVMEAEQTAQRYLPEETESYLVFLLMRYQRRPDLVRRVMAMTYLRAMLSSGRVQQERLQDVGDQCLMLAGLFPGQAARRRVRVDYFVELGRGAYYRRAAGDADPDDSVYASLAQHFPDLMRVLQAIRQQRPDQHPELTVMPDTTRH
ncbi:MAG: hypothetical protein JJT90_12045 [Ectothiorhodospiraceae bacterium]|nr:hypothetical protein [Ectothiorhodospiraceae bacterium]